MPKYYYNQIIRKRSGHPALNKGWVGIFMYYKSHNASSVCRYFGVSRKTFYKWLNRYEDSGKDHLSLIDASKRPKNSPKETKEDLQKLILKTP